MPRSKRVKTKYLGVYYVTGRSKLKYGKAELIYYIRYRKDGREFEEKVGRQFQDAMTPSKAAMIRAECIEGKRLPQKGTPYREKKENKKTLNMPLNNGLARTVGRFTGRIRSQDGLQERGRAGTLFRAFNDKVGEDEQLDQNTLAHIDRDLTREELIAKLKMSEEKFKTIFYNARAQIIFVDLDGRVIDVNPAVENIFGQKPEEIIGMNISETTQIDEEFKPVLVDSLKKLASKDPQTIIEMKGYHKNGSTVFFEVTIKLVKEGPARGFISVIRDITRRKLAEEESRKHREHLDELVKERTLDLEQANAALKVLLKRREEDKADLEEKTVLNVKEMVLPFLEELKNSHHKDQQTALINIIENNLNDIISPFVKTLGSGYYNLTPTEIRIAGLIKEGMSTKEIAEQLKMSIRTVDNHRYRIRKKLGIAKKKTNLATYLLSLN